MPEDAANDRKIIKVLNPPPPTGGISKDPPSRDPDQKHKKGGVIHSKESKMSEHKHEKHHGHGHPQHHTPKHDPHHETPFVHHHKHGGHVDSHVPHMDHIRKHFHGK